MPCVFMAVQYKQRDAVCVQQLRAPCDRRLPYTASKTMWPRFGGWG